MANPIALKFSRLSYQRFLGSNRRISLFPRMTLHTLEHRYVAKIHRMLERLVGFVTGFAFAIGEAAEIDRMLNRKRLEKRLQGALSQIKPCDRYCNRLKSPCRCC